MHTHGDKQGARHEETGLHSRLTLNSISPGHSCGWYTNPRRGSVYEHSSNFRMYDCLVRSSTVDLGASAPGVQENKMQN